MLMRDNNQQHWKASTKTNKQEVNSAESNRVCLKKERN